MSESYSERASREGPLPKVEDDSELVGDDNLSAAEKKTEGVAQEHGAGYVAVPMPGAGAFPAQGSLPGEVFPVPNAAGSDGLPTPSAEDAEDQQSPPEQEAER